MQRSVMLHAPEKIIFLDFLKQKNKYKYK